MKKLLTILFSIVLLAFSSISPVLADGKIDGGGSVDIPGKQVSIIDFPDTPKEEEEIPEAGGEIVDGELSVSLNFDEPTKFAIRTEDMCGAINNIVVETSVNVNGNIVVSEASVEDEKLENQLGSCKFELEGFDSSAIKNVEWNIRVGRNDLEEAGIGLNAVKLFLQDEDNWDRIRTDRTDESNSEEVAYKASTDNFQDGIAVVAESGSSFLTAENIAYVIFSIVGLLILLAIGYLLLKKEE